MTFAACATTGEARVVRVEPTPEGALVVVDATPFHPVDHTWPDQPGDTGTLGGSPVIDCVMAAEGADGVLLVGPAIPARRGDEGWTWVAAHVLDGVPPAVGEGVRLEVDPARRRDLSAAHTACHLAALAMNQVTAGLWREGKEMRRDSLGSPDLDQIAMSSSVMDRTGSTDVYRLGKSLRKKGFDAGALTAQLDDVAEQVRQLLAGWVATDAVVQVEDGGDRRLTGRRHWVCELPEGTGRLPCGGTHLARLGELSGIDVRYTLSEDGTGVTVRTTPQLAS